MSTSTPIASTSRSDAPRVNLLPPEIALAAKVRKVKAGCAVAGLLSLAAVGGLFSAARSDLADAEVARDASVATHGSLLVQAEQYADVPRTQAAVAAAETRLTQAMGQEIRWSSYLNELSQTIPDGVWLTGMTVTQAVDATAAATTSPVGTPGIGTITFEGKAREHVDVAAWLDAWA